MQCGVIRLRHAQPARWQRLLFAAATFGGIGLIIISRSGHMAVMLAAAAALVAVWLVRARATAGTYAVLALSAVVVVPALVLMTAVFLGDRLGGGSAVGNSSWAERSSSLVIGLGLLAKGDLPTLLFGFGPGLSSPALLKAARLEAVWSVLLTYVYETGLLGIAAVAWIGACLARVWRASRRSLAFAAVAGVWLVGITLTTSYEQLLSIWLVLGWLSVWPEFCETVPAPVRAAAVSPTVPAAPPAGRPAWKWTANVDPVDAMAASPLSAAPPPRRRWTE